MDKADFTSQGRAIVLISRDLLFRGRGSYGYLLQDSGLDSFSITEIKVPYADLFHSYVRGERIPATDKYVRSISSWRKPHFERRSTPNEPSESA